MLGGVTVGEGDGEGVGEASQHLKRREPQQDSPKCYVENGFGLQDCAAA